MSWKGWENFVPDVTCSTRLSDFPHGKTDVKRRAAKFGNVKTRGFDSKGEERRYRELKARLLAGEITDLECQPEYVMHTRTPQGELIKVGRVKFDFRYREHPHDWYQGGQFGLLVVEDFKTKATKTTAYQLRKKHVEAEYNITIIEVE